MEFLKGRDEYNGWRTNDPDAQGRGGRRRAQDPVARAAYVRDAYLEDVNAGAAENARRRAEHERIQDILQAEAKSKARIKAAKRKMNEILASPPTTKAGIKKHLESCARPMINYILERIKEPPPPDQRNGKIHHGDRFKAVEFFRGAALLNPRTFKNDTIAERRARIEKLCSHPFLDSDEIREGLRQEVTSLLLSCNGTPLPEKMDDYKFLRFHWKHKKDRPYCYKAAKVVAITQPSSATVERVFSMLRAMFGEQQTSMKGDKKSLGLKYRYNRRFDEGTDGDGEESDSDNDEGEE